jgi:hypothetical protein
MTKAVNPRAGERPNYRWPIAPKIKSSTEVFKQYCAPPTWSLFNVELASEAFRGLIPPGIQVAIKGSHSWADVPQ